MNEVLNGFSANMGREHCTTMKSRRDLVRIIRKLGDRTAHQMQGEFVKMDDVVVRNISVETLIAGR
jgi:hypothetical protein